MPIQMTLVQCGWEIADQSVVDKRGEKKVVGKTVIVQDQVSGIVVIIPLDDPIARQWAAKLEGRPVVDVATHVPGVPDLRNGNGQGNNNLHPIG